MSSLGRALDFQKKVAQRLDELPPCCCYIPLILIPFIEPPRHPIDILGSSCDEGDFMQIPNLAYYERTIFNKDIDSKYCGALYYKK